MTLPSIETRQKQALEIVKLAMDKGLNGSFRTAGIDVNNDDFTFNYTFYIADTLYGYETKYCLSYENMKKAIENYALIQKKANVFQPLDEFC